MCSIELRFGAWRSKYFGGVSKFLDEVFREYVSENFDTDEDGVLSDSEIEAVTQITAGGYFDYVHGGE